MTEPGRKPQTRGPAVREKILDTADALFYREGVRAIGVDTIVERSGVAKASLYRWFATKDDLVAAYLERRDAQFWAQWGKVADRHRGRPREELAAHLTWITRYLASPGYRGCPFINTATEFPDRKHPGRAKCEANKRMLRERLLALCRISGASDPELLADQLVLLIDGAFVSAQVMGRTGPARSLETAGLALIESALREHAARGSKEPGSID